MAPEAFVAGTTITERVDVYAFGIILWQLITREQRPFLGITTLQDLVPALQVPDPFTSSSVLTEIGRRASSSQQRAARFAQLLGLVLGNEPQWAPLLPSGRRHAPGAHLCQCLPLVRPVLEGELHLSRVANRHALLDDRGSSLADA